MSTVQDTLRRDSAQYVAHMKAAPSEGSLPMATVVVSLSSHPTDPDLLIRVQGCPGLYFNSLGLEDGYPLRGSLELASEEAFHTGIT